MNRRLCTMSKIGDGWSDHGMGRLKIDADGRVQSTDGEPIPGLYAAGEITGLFYHKQPPETLVLRANTFGRIIGAKVAESLPETAETRG
jgi:tricarballylate dehydrogenase